MQIVNLIAGISVIAAKVTISTSGISVMPPGLLMPRDEKKLEEYVGEHPDARLLSKGRAHKGIQ